jgi:hypothetical protein
MLKTTPNSDCHTYFTESLSPIHKQYLALRDFFAEGLTAEQVAVRHGYSIGTVYGMTRDFRQTLKNNEEDPFFKTVKVGRKPIDHEGEIAETVVNLRKNITAYRIFRLHLMHREKAHNLRDRKNIGRCGVCPFAEAGQARAA